MALDYNEIDYLKDPSDLILHADYVQFLLSLISTTVIDVTGKDVNKCRVITTLLQGNEPSGFIAIHRWLTSRDRDKLPATNIRFIICSIEAASEKPVFSQRFIKGGKDLNRCFGQSSKTASEDNYQRADLIEQAIRDVNPEVVIDLHNASSPCPAFAISSLITTKTLSLASLFCQTLILSDLKLGALMEQNFSCPLVTIECGGHQDEQAHEVAYAGIKQVATCQNIGYIHQENKVEVIYRPHRMLLNSGVKLSFAEHDAGHRGVTLKSNIECFNFGVIQQDEMIGWIDGNGLDNLQILDDKNRNIIDEYFYARDNQLVSKKNLRLFKATTNKDVALNDCLFYFVDQSRTDI